MTKCENCGKTKPGNLTFWIGAASNAHESDDAGGFVMVEGTGRIVCSVCYPGESRRGADRIDAHIEAHNRRCREARP